jgi:LL-diaminopimelate aminotransferase
VLVKGLNNIGWKTKKPKATFYIWTHIPEGETSSMDFVKKLIDVGVILTPGNGFGKYGEGFVRFALTQPVDKIKEALERIERTLN